MRSFWDTPNAASQFSATNTPNPKDIRLPSLPVSNRYLQTPAKRTKDSSMSLILRDNNKNELKTISVNKKIPTILAMSGSTGAQLEETVAQALKSKKQFNLIAVTGKNSKLRETLSKINDPRLIVQGYETDMDSLISKSDLGILRPHGLSATEVAGKGLPFIPTVTNRTSDA
jgi:UDP-N-acetylglucosamine:LPS N-acetylglucosamine transferase